MALQKLDGTFANAVNCRKIANIAGAFANILKDSWAQVGTNIKEITGSKLRMLTWIRKPISLRKLPYVLVSRHSMKIHPRY